jgi:hypothetical protein
MAVTEVAILWLACLAMLVECYARAVPAEALGEDKSSEPHEGNGV